VLIRLALLVMLGAGASGMACGRSNAPPAAPAGAERADTVTIESVLARHTDSLMAIPGVVGVARTERGGKPAIMVLVDTLTTQLRKALPDSLEGYEVVINESGVIRAQ
jgi:hypothetical protein